MYSWTLKCLNMDGIRFCGSTLSHQRPVVHVGQLWPPAWSVLSSGKEFCLFFFKIVFEIILWSQLIWKSLGISHSSVRWTIIIRKNSQLIGFADRKPIGNVSYMLLNTGPLFVNWRWEENGEAGRTIFWSLRLAPASAVNSFSFSTLVV